MFTVVSLTFFVSGAAGPIFEVVWFHCASVGTRHAKRQTVDAFAAPWSVPALAARLREVGFEQPAQIGATLLGDAGYLRELTAATPPLTDDFPHRIVPVPMRPSLSDPRYRDDPHAFEMFQQVLDPARARRAFAASEFVGRLWPAALIEQTLSFFQTQRIINRALWDGGQPLRQIEDLHLLRDNQSFARRCGRIGERRWAVLTGCQQLLRTTTRQARRNVLHVTQ